MSESPPGIMEAFCRGAEAGSTPGRAARTDQAEQELPAMKRPVTAVLTMAFGTVLALAAGEVVLRIAHLPQAMIAGWVSSSSVAPQEKNQMGFRGHPIGYGDSTFVIALVGDSQVEATHLAWDWMPECRLEHYLEELYGRDVEVVSVAAQGYGQDQQLLALEYYFRNFRADMVVIWETPANDLWNNTFPTHWPANGWAKPTFWIEDGRLAGPSEQLGERIQQPSLKIAALLESVLGGNDRDGAWEYRLPEAYSPDSIWPGEVRDDWQQRWETNLGLMRDENLATEKSHLAIYLTPRSARMQYSIELTHMLLERIDSLAGSNGASLVLFSVAGPPDPTGDVDEATYALDGAFYHVSREQYRSNIEEYNSGFDFYQIPLRIENWKMGPLNSHLNEHATDLLMQDLAFIIAPMLRSDSPAVPDSAAAVR